MTSSEGFNAKLEELQKELLKLANSKKDYNNIADEIYRLRELKQNALVENAEREGLKQRIQEMQLEKLMMHYYKPKPNTIKVKLKITF